MLLDGATHDGIQPNEMAWGATAAHLRKVSCSVHSLLAQLRNDSLGCIQAMLQLLDSDIPISHLLSDLLQISLRQLQVLLCLLHPQPQFQIAKLWALISVRGCPSWQSDVTICRRMPSAKVYQILPHNAA